MGAEYILDGSVQRSGQRLRINAQVIRVRDGASVWSNTFDRPVTDVFAIQDEISLGIVNSLRLTLGSGRRRYETSVEAYDFYLRARALIIQHGLSGYDKSIGPFEQAIAKDAAFAPAYAGLAVAHAARSGQFRFDLADEAIRMRTAAETAHRLDPLLPEAHEALGMVYARDGRWEQSEKSFRRAIELDGGRSASYNAFSMYLLWPLGRTEEALRQLRLAEKTNPLSPDVQYTLSVLLTSLRRYDEAAAFWDKFPEDHPYKMIALGKIRLGQGKVDEAIQLLEPAFRQRSLEGAIRGDLGCGYARAGRREEAERVAAAGSINPFNQAVIYACLGDKERVFEALNRATPAGPIRMGRELTVRREYDLLRGDPRLAALRNKVGLPSN